MQNKGAITLLAVALALVSLYQLFFTYKTNQVENAAKEFANGNPIKEKEYLDSVANQPVYNFLGLAKFTYKECKELELNLGLDLKGGMNVTMEVDVVDVVKSLANHSTDPAFNQAIEEAVKMRVSSPKDFVTLFGEAFEKIAPGAQLASPAIFGTHEMKEKIKVGATNKLTEQSTTRSTFFVLVSTVVVSLNPISVKPTSPEESLSSCRVSKNRNV